MLYIVDDRQIHKFDDDEDNNSTLQIHTVKFKKERNQISQTPSKNLLHEFVVIQYDDIKHTKSTVNLQLLELGNGILSN